MHERVEYAVQRSSEELERLEPEWRELWRQDAGATPFQSPEWLLPWWRQFGTEAPRVVTIRRQGKLLGLLPFYIYREPASGLRRLMLLGVGTSDYLDGVFAPACTAEQVRMAVELVLGLPGWDTFSVTQLRRDSRLHAALEGWGECQPLACDSCSRMAAVRMEGLPPKIRRNARYYAKQAARMGQLECVTVDAANWEQDLENLERLHAERWQARGESGVLADDRVRRWHREAMPRLQGSGLLRLCALRLAGETIASLYSLIDPPQRVARTQYFYLTGISVRYGHLRPGTVLLARAIERAAAEGVQTIDMLRGDEEYKRIWRMERVPTYGWSADAVGERRAA